MTSVEKRRSSRKSGGRRKRSNGYSDTSSTGSYQDETDREVSSLTDRAFRSLCIGDEAIYNDSDLCSSPPCSHREKQLALNQSGQNRESREREELKRAAHDSFSLRMQQYGQEWLHAGMHRAEVHRDPHWEGYGEMMQERLSATFQRSLVETSRHEQSHSNGVAELSSHHRTSGSRISSLIRTFNSDRHTDGAGLGGRYEETGQGPSWDKSALMSIQRELCEFTNSHSGDFNADYLPTTGQLPYRDSNFYPSEVAAVAHMNSGFHSASYSNYSMSSQINGNSHVFIHSEFSPFRVWRNHNRFPFKQEQVSGFMHTSHFPKWYETPMYKEVSQETYPHNTCRFKDRGMGYPTNNMVPLGPPSPPRSTSTSTVLQKALAVEKRCESEQMGHYTHRKRTQSLGTNRLPSQRPSTASPTTEMSRYVGETITSVKSLQQKLKVRREQEVETGMVGNQHGALCSSDDSIPPGNNTVTVAPNVMRSKTAPLNAKYTTPPAQYAHRGAEVSGLGEASTSPQLIEHAPVRAESRGATPDVRMSSYRSRATSFLFNLKDNRKRVKNTYSPTPFKNYEVPEKPWPVQEPRDTITDLPDYTGPDFQSTQREGSGRVHAVANPYVNQYQNPDPSMASLNSNPQAVHMAQFSQYAPRDYQRPHRQGETRYSSVSTGHVTENFTPNRLTNGQCLHDGRLSFAERSMTDDVEAVREDVHGFKASYSAAETTQNTCVGVEPYFNETMGRNLTNVMRPQQLQDTCNQNYGSVLSQDKWRQTSSQDTEKLNAHWKKEISAPLDKEPQTQDYQSADTKRESLKLPLNKYKEQNHPVINKGMDKMDLRQSSGTGTSIHKNISSVHPNILKQQPQYAGEVSNYSVENDMFYKQQPAETTDKNAPKKYLKNINGDKSKEDSLTPQQFTEKNQHASNNERDKTSKRKPNVPLPDGYQTQSLQQVQTTPQLDGNMLKSPLSNPDPAAAPTAKTQVKLKQPTEVKAEQATSEHIKAPHTQAELAEAQRQAQVEQPKADSARLILAGQTVSEEVSAEKARAELKECETGRTVEAKTETKVVEQAETFKEMGSKDAKKQQLETKPAPVQNKTEKPKQEGETRVKEEQGKQVKSDETEADIQQKGNIQTPPVKTEQAKPQAVQEVRAEEGKGKVKEQTETIQIQMEQTKDKQAERQERKEEQTEGEQIKQQKAEAEQEKNKADEGAKVKDDIKVEDARKEKKSKKYVNQAGHINSEQNAHQEAKEAVVKKKVNLELMKDDPAKTDQAETRVAKVQLTRAELEKPELEIAKVIKPDIALADVTKPELAKSETLAKTETAQTQLVKPEVTKLESAKSESTKPEVAKPVLTQPDMCKSELTKPVQPKTDPTNMEMLIKTGKEHSGQQKVKGEPDKVEQVRMELAKAKAELAKIKVKMRGEVKHPLSTTGEYMSWDYVNNNEELKKHDQPTDIHQNSDFSKTDGDQVDRGGSDYEKIVAKYSFKEVSQNEGSNDEKTPVSPPAAAEREHQDRTKDKQSPKSELRTKNAENKEEVNNCNCVDVTDGHYVYSESLKEFTLSTTNHSPQNVENKDVCNAADKKDIIGNRQKCDAVKEKHISQQRNSDLIKPPSIDRKAKNTEHTTVQSKDLGFTPPKALTQKERAQTKQEILTSKIKAHAEKEISAIKEKGLRDGLMSKNSTKQLAGGQNINVRQRPPSQEVPKKHESTVSGNTTTKPLMEPAEIQGGPVKSSTPTSSNKIPVMSTAIVDPSVDHSQKQAHKVAEKINDTLPESPGTAKEKQSCTKHTDEGRNKLERNLLVTSPLQNQEQPTKNSRAKQEIKDRTKSKKQKEEHEDSTPTNSDTLSKKDEGLSQVKAGSENARTTEDPEHKHESVFEASAPSVNLVFQDQSKTSVVDDSLQIMAIMVTVRERKPSENYDVEANSSKEQMNINKIKDPSDRVSKVNESSNKLTAAVSKHRTADERCERQKKNPTEMVLNDSLESDLEILSERKDNASKAENMISLEESTVNSRQKTETERQEHVDEKAASSIITAPAKNTALSGIQPRPNNKDVMDGDTKVSMNKKAENSVKSVKKEETKTTNTKESLTVKVENTGADIKQNPSQSELLKHENMIMNTRPSNSGKVDSSNAPLLGERRQNTQALSPPCVSPKIQLNQTQNEKNKEVDDLHIDSIAIRVVPAAAKRDKENISEKPCAAAVLSDVAKASEPKEVAAQSERQVEVTKEEELGVQDVLLSVKKLSASMRNSNQQNNRNATGGLVQAQTGEPVMVEETEKSVDNSKSEPMEGGYFQVQGAEETSDELHKGKYVEEILDSVSKRGELPGSKPNKASPSSKSYKELHNEAYVLDPILRKTLESSATKVQHETTKKNECETEGTSASKQSESVSEKQSNQKKLENQGHQTSSHSSSSASEKQSLSTTNPTRENSVSTKSEVKPKPRASTIPEISALADYARLKVIVSEERENPIQELPRNKKEGFFPLIHTRHSRRPVFDTEPKEVPVKEQSSIHKAEATAKVNKEPKALVFPITEKEHQKTGMFKLGDKERQEKMLSDTPGVSEPEAKHGQRVKDKIKSPTSLFKNQGQNEQVAANKAPNPALKTTLTLTAVNKPKNTSASQHLVSPVSFNTQEKHERSLKDERMNNLDQDSHQQPTSLQENLREGKRASRKNEAFENKLAMSRDERIEKQREEVVAQEKEETAVKESEKNAAYYIEYEKQAEDIKKRIIEESRASLAEEERRAAQREEERRAKEREAIALKIKERREKQKAERRAEEEGKAKQIKENKAAPRLEEATVKPRQEEAKVKEIDHITEDKKAAPEPQRRTAADEHRMRTAQEEQPRKKPQVQQERRVALQKDNVAALEKQQSGTTQQQRRAEQTEQQRRVELEKGKQRRAAQEEQQRGAAEEQQRRMAQEEQQKQAKEREQQRRAAEEQQRRMAQEEQQRRAAEEQQRRAAQEEQQRRAAEEQQRRMAQEEQQRGAAEEQQRRAAQEEQQRRAAEEQQRRAAQEEQQRRAAEEQQRRAAEEQQRRMAQEEQQRRAAEEQQRRAAEEQQRRMAQEEQQRRAAEEQQRRAAQEEQHRILQEVQQRRAAKQEQHSSAVHEQQRRVAEERAAMERQQIEVDEQKTKGALVEEQKVLSDIRALAKEQTREDGTIQHDPVRQRWTSQRADELKAKTRDSEMFPAQREKEQKMEEQRKAAQMRDALQYYAINSTASERKVKERHLFSPLPSQPKTNPSVQEPDEDSGANTRTYRPHGSTSPAPPRSSTSSPALAVKPSMFRVKDNTSRGSSFTKPVKPRFHKNLGEEFQVGSPVEKASERIEEEQETLRQGAGTPANSETRFNKLAAIKELSSSRPTSTSQELSGYQPQHRPFSRRSMAMDEDDSRSVISNMSEGVESFATSAADLADIRGLYDYERPESACSYSSDMSRSMGKPPTVPPKSEKALERAKRLTSRRIKKELSKAPDNSHAGGGTPLQEVLNSPPSASNEVDSSKQHAVAYPHFSSPISLAKAPHSSSSSFVDQPSSRRPVQASPHATGPISIALPHVTAAGTVPVATTTTVGSVPNSTVLKTVPRVSSSPTVYHTNHPGPVTQYRIETGYPQSYPLTQRKVLQDLGSGQYYVVDVPIQVKTKTFFDPETGKYVQLNVRESGQSTTRTQPQQTFPQPHLQTPMQVKPQQNQPQATTTAKPSMLYHGYHGYSQSYQPALNSLSPYRSLGSGVPLQNQQSIGGNHSYGYQTHEMRGNSEGHHHSPEKTPYMDTVNDSEKTYNRVYSTHGSYEAFPECDTNRQLAGSSVCENENSAHTQYQPRDIITMGELEDFMEVSDW